MLVSWRGPACLAETSPIPPTLSGMRKRALRAAPLFARGEWRPAPPSPAARFAHSPHPPLGLRPRQENRIPERGKGALYRHPLRLRLADGATSASAAAIAARSHGALPPPCPRKPPAGGWARRWRASPHPTRQRRQSHKRAGMRRAQRAASAAPLVCASRPAPSSRPRLRAVPRRAPLAHPAACAAAAPVASPRAAAGSLSRGSSGNRAAFSGCIVGPGVAARLSPAQLAGPAGFPFLLHFFPLRLANNCSIWYNCIGRFCL